MRRLRGGVVAGCGLSFFRVTLCTCVVLPVLTGGHQRRGLPQPEQKNGPREQAMMEAIDCGKHAPVLLAHRGIGPAGTVDDYNEMVAVVNLSSERALSRDAARAEPDHGKMTVSLTCPTTKPDFSRFTMSDAPLSKSAIVPDIDPIAPATPAHTAQSLTTFLSVFAFASTAVAGALGFDRVSSYARWKHSAGRMKVTHLAAIALLFATPVAADTPAHEPQLTQRKHAPARAQQPTRPNDVQPPRVKTEEVGLTAKFANDVDDVYDRNFVCLTKYAHADLCPEPAEAVTVARAMIPNAVPIAHAWLTAIEDALSKDPGMVSSLCGGVAPGRSKLYLIGTNNATTEAFPNMPVARSQYLDAAISGVVGRASEGEVWRMADRAARDHDALLRANPSAIPFAKEPVGSRPIMDVMSSSGKQTPAPSPPPPRRAGGDGVHDGGARGGARTREHVCSHLRVPRRAPRSFAVAFPLLCPQMLSRR